MATRNDITGDLIATRQITDSYRDNFDKIFRKKKDEPANPAADAVQESPTTTDIDQQQNPLD